jgi:hypothetical protein
MMNDAWQWTRIRIMAEEWCWLAAGLLLLDSV